MKTLIISMLVLVSSIFARAQNDALPDSPLDTSMGEKLVESSPEDDFEREQEQERQEELLENRYDVPEDKEDEKFNLNGPNNP